MEETEKKEMSILDYYNADTPEGAAMRERFDLKDNTLVPKEVQDNQTELNAIIEPLEQESKSYGEMIDQWQKDREAYEAESNKRIERVEQASQWGSIVEAASSLVNLIGTTKGATSMQIASHSQAWKNEADALRRERDSKLDNYRSQMSTLRKMKQDIEMKKATVKSAYNAQKETTARQNARLAQQAMVTITKEANKANIQAESARKTVANNAYKIFNDFIRLGYLGDTLDDASSYAELAYDLALRQYKSNNPGEFDGSSATKGNVPLDSI